MSLREDALSLSSTFLLPYSSFLLTSPPRMVFPVDFLQMLTGNVRVNLGGDDIGVAQEDLDAAQVGAAF